MAQVVIPLAISAAIALVSAALTPGPPTLEIQGNRQQNLDTPLAPYGRPIPILFGTNRVRDPVIFWADEVKEEVVRSKSRVGGKGGIFSKQQKVVNTDFQYFQDFAVLLGEGPAADLQQIFLLGNKIYDQNEPKADEVRFRFYKGTTDQMPDPLLVQFFGEDTCPAYRGLAYVVFERFPLSRFGIPNVAALALTFVLNSEFRQPTQLPVDSAPTNAVLTTTNPAADYERNWIVSGSEGTTDYLLFDDLDTLARIRTIPLEAEFNSLALEIFGTNPKDGSIVVARDDHAQLLDPISGIALVDVDISPDQLQETPSCIISLVTEAFQFYTLVNPTGGSQYRVYDLDNEFSLIGTLNVNNLTANCVAAFPGSGVGFCITTDLTNNVFALHQIQIVPQASLADPGTFVPGVTFTLLREFAPADFGGVDVLASRISIDVLTDTLILRFNYNEDTGAVVRYDVDVENGSEIVWSTFIPDNIQTNVGSGAAAASDRISGGQISFLSQSGGFFIYTLRISDGSLEDPPLDGSEPIGATFNNNQFYDDDRNAVYYFIGGVLTRLKVLGRDFDEVAISEIFRRLCPRVGLDSFEDIDTRQVVSDEVQGFRVDGPVRFRDAVDSLRRIFFFDIVEVNGRITLVKRGAAPVVTISSSEFVVDENEIESFGIERIEPTSLPSKLGIEFFDPDRGFESNFAFRKRPKLPDQTIESDNQDVITALAAIPVDLAKRVVDMAINVEIIERQKFTARLPIKYLYLTVGDSFIAEFTPTRVERVRIIQATIGLDYTQKVALARELLESYTSVTLADGGAIAPNSSAPSGASQLFLLDTPLLFDAEAVVPPNSRLHVSASDFGGTNWPGATLSKALDGSAFEGVEQFSVPAAWGVTYDVLGNVESPFVLDETNSIFVMMVQGSEFLENITFEELLSSRNGLVLIKRNGEVSVNQYQNFESLGGNKFRLYNLARGQRGTDSMDRDHTSGEQLILLDSDTVSSLIVPLSERNLTRLYKLTTNGQMLELGVTQSFITRCRDLMPYAPTMLTGEMSGDDIVFEWIRRSRVAGGNVLATISAGTLPLGEETEAYELDIFDEEGGDVLLTLESTTPTVTFVEADIITHFGGPITEVFVELYQLSTAVGRGFPLRKLVEIVP